MKYRSLFLLVLLLFASNVLAWNDEETHPTISGKAATVFFGESFIKQEVNGKMALDWIKDGSILEDTGSVAQFIYNGTARSLSHFHNASKSTFAEARLNDLPSFLPIVGERTWESTLLWAQDGDNQKTKVQGDWSWSKVRDLYFKSLTTPDKTVREQLQADYLTGLGYQMHLIQDMGQPNHVRNDTHVWDGASLVMGLETWARKNDEKMLAILNSKDLPVVTVDLKVPFGPEAPPDKLFAPVARLFDTRGYKGTRQPTATFDQGLAEYTNSNFFSESTIFSSEYPANDRHYQPYPKKSETNIQDYINKQMSLTRVTTDDDLVLFDAFLVSKQATTGEKLNCLAAAGPFSRKLYQERGEDKYFYRSFIYDICFPEYAEKLIPASAAYSKGLLEYFHRGKIKLTPASPEDITFRSIKVTVQNDTAGENMGLGDVSLVIRYKALAETPVIGDKWLLSNPSSVYSYKVITLPGKIELTPPKILTFDLSSDTLPMNYSDMTLQLIYRGPLGNEVDAVAVSTPYVIDGIYSNFDVSLPSSGVYAKVAGESLDGSFNELRVTALTDNPGGLSGGTFSLALEYRLALDNPFESKLVLTDPKEAVGYIIKVPVKNGVNSLVTGVETELVFDLSSAPLPVKATDVHLNVVYSRSGDNKPIAIGYNDISEPTPVDVFNNADKICIKKQWYDAGSPDAISLANSNGDLFDPYAHNITNIFTKDSSSTNTTPASATNFTFQSPAELTGGAFRRLGYILTDYTFNYSLLENWVNVTQNSPWAIIDGADQYPGTAVKNQTDADGTQTIPVMYNIRGKKIWWGAGVVYENDAYQSDPTCDWNTLP